MNLRRGAACALLALTTAGLPLAGAEAHPRPAVHVLDGDPAAVGGSRFEGIGVDPAERLLYVSETTGGEIHRGLTTRRGTAVWLEGDGTDGRFTARGITVDSRGRVYIAGGPNRIDRPGSPDLWVYGPRGRLLAALQVPATGSFLNDVAIGPDGAAYFTDSNTPRVFRVARGPAGWAARLWVDASSVITQQPGFNLGGIVLAADGAAFVVAQGNVGVLWRFDVRTRTVTRVRTGTVDLTGADGLVLRGDRLTVVRNFPRVLTTLRLRDSATATRLEAEVATDPARVFTTAKVAHGRLLLVDSKFDEPTPAPPYQVVALDLAALR